MPVPSVSTAVFDGYPMETALATLASMGIDRVEPAYIRGYVDFDETAFSAKAAHDFARLLSAHGLTAQAVSAHMSLADPDASDALARRIGFAAGIGCPILITNAGPATGRDEILRNITANLDPLADAGVKLALENPGHGRGDLLGTGADGATLIASIDAPQVGLNYDFGNIWTYGQERVRPETDFPMALPHVIHAHLKDMRAVGPDWMFCPLGQGDITYDRIADLVGQVPLALELPLRLTRPNRGDPIRGRHPLPLQTIETAIADSLAFWDSLRRPAV